MAVSLVFEPTGPISKFALCLPSYTILVSGSIIMSSPSTSLSQSANMVLVPNVSNPPFLINSLGGHEL